MIDVAGLGIDSFVSSYEIKVLLSKMLFTVTETIEHKLNR